MIRKVLILTSLLFIAACGGGGEEAATGGKGEGAALTIPELIGASAWDVDETASLVGFKATQNNKEFEGRFSRFKVGVVLDPEAPESEGQIVAAIDLASIDAGNSDRNGALPQESWFHVAMHPVAIFNSKSVTKTGDGAYVAGGTLTIKGITKDVAMPFTLQITEDGRAIADGSVVLNRSDFQVGTGEFATDQWVGFGVEVILHIEAEPAA